jgi:hypothetical protein
MEMSYQPYSMKKLDGKEKNTHILIRNIIIIITITTTTIIIIIIFIILTFIKLEDQLYYGETHTNIYIYI